MALPFFTKPLQVLLKIIFPRKPRDGDTGAGGADEQLREWTEKLDAWLAPLKTNPAAREAFAFLQRLLRENPTDPLDSVGLSSRHLPDLCGKCGCGRS